MEPYLSPKVSWKDKKAMGKVVVDQMGVPIFLCQTLTQKGQNV